MMAKNKMRLSLILATMMGLAVLFQQCSDVSFESGSAALGSLDDPQNPNDPNNPNNPNDPNEPLPLEKVDESFDVVIDDPYAKVDMLFVVDESVSMKPYIDAINQGFASIQGSEFLLDTRMAVTNMAPALLSDSGQVLFDTPFKSQPNNANFRKWIAASPGFMRLVSDQSIAQMLFLFPTYSPQFPLAGCGEWFGPKETNSLGQSCLASATQISRIGIDVEAGVMSFSQLIDNHNRAQKRLFREKSSVHVVFVSDTHDAGSLNYYTKPGAPAAIPQYQDVVNKVYANSDRLMALKFHGIVPLPKVGSPELEGLNVLGNVPATDEEARGGEGDALTKTYSYLPFIKASDGVGIHFKNTGWSGLLRNLVLRLPVQSEPTVHLRKTATRILKVVVNNRDLTADEYELQPDGLSLKVKVAVSNALEARIFVKYE